jgi:leader peptidase (prepilin peptidase)/N-methyltransferase
MQRPSPARKSRNAARRSGEAAAVTLSALVSVLGVLAAPFVGSFLGTVIIRLPAGRAVALGRSACPHCGRRLRPRDLVPLVSWLLHRGRCRQCGAALGLFYPLVELAALAVALSAVAAMENAPPWLLLASLGMGWVLLASAWIDARHYLLPDALVLPLIPAGLAVSWMVAPESLIDHLLGAAIGYGGLALIAVLYRRLRGREGLGAGDAKLMAAAGAWVAWQGLPGVLLVASLAGLLAAVAQAARGHRPTAESKLAFGPYLALGLWLVWLLGPLSIG